MSHFPARFLAAAAAAATLTLVLPSVPAEAGTFGHHVAACAQTHGFSGSHNPGTHRGASDWDGTGCTP